MRSSSSRTYRKWAHARALGVCVLAVRLLLPIPAASQSLEDLVDVSLRELMNVNVVTPSRLATPLSKTPATSYVITREQIRGLGAQDIYDVLRTVPGLGVAFSNRTKQITEVRGVRSLDDATGILFLLDGHPLAFAQHGEAAFLGLADLAVQNVKRIEVIPGPGSAVYGTDALLGTINVITYDPDDLEGAEVYVAGEHESEGSVGQLYNVVAGTRLENELGFVANANFVDRDGPHLPVEADAAGRSGVASTKYEQIDLYGRADRGRFSFQGRYHQQERGTGFGSIDILSPDENEDTKGWFAEGRGTFALGEDRELRVRASHDWVFRDWFLMPFPPGSIPAGSPMTPWNQDGFRANLQTKESKTIGEVVATFGDFSRHQLLLGFTAQYHRLYDYRQVGNFDACPSGSPVPGPCFLPGDQDVTETWPSLANVDRNLFAAFAEDLWDVTDDFRVSLGARYDHYSDFGDSFNPRLGATWAAREGLDLRAHYGTAFRAPTFVNLTSRNNPGNVGNPDLGPEEVETFELGLDAFPSDRVSVRVTGFFNRLEDLIATDQITSRFENGASGDATGVETEVRLRSNGHSLVANYTYTDVGMNAARFGSVPQHRGNVVADLRVRRWNLNVHFYGQGKTRRETGDTRAEIPSHSLLDAALTTPTFFGHAALQLRGSNLLDEEYRDPSPVDGVPGDYTTPRRSFLLALSLRT